MPTTTYNQILFSILVFIFITFSNVFTQTEVQLKESEDSKIWPRMQIDVLRAMYTDANGTPSHRYFLKNNGLYSSDISIELTPYFMASFDLKDIIKTNGQIRLRPTAKPYNLDFYVETIKKYRAFNQSKPIWDGRTYMEDNRMYVGGYSSRYNERKVAKINDQGHFIKTIDSDYSNNFPILSIPAEEIIFDPFQMKLLHVLPSKGKIIIEQNKSFLPIILNDNQGIPIKGPHYGLEFSENSSSIKLFTGEGDRKINLASCNILESTITEIVEGYRPKLIKGCVQPGNGEMVRLAFQANFSNNININNSELQLTKSLNNNTFNSNQTNASPTSFITIDGNFQDWRNISGIIDPEGDYVSYLYPNPDTDILEFKVSHDEKHLYLYSRLAGAHGRTGPKGRYYWYVYIDVDHNPYTGYPPTRDDNCYFGVAIGDDAEAQFEFVGNKFVKTFFGFTGVGAEKEALAGKLKLGPSHYSPNDPRGNKRDRYKIEYVNRENKRFITHDYTEGTSEDIIIALSPDGSEVEMRVEYAGFLTDESGIPLMKPGDIIDIAVGAEGASDHYGSDDWGADSSPVIYNYHLGE